jgi:hypothetical protein
MLVALTLLSGFPSAVPAEDASPYPAVAAIGGELRASQIADVPRERDAVLAKLPDGVREVILPADERLTLLRNRYPGGRYSLRHGGTLRVLRQPVHRQTGEQPACAASSRDIPAGGYVDSTALAGVPCRDGRDGTWLSYDDDAGAFRAIRAIPRGTYLGRLAGTGAPPAVSGEPLIYQSREGPVTIEREVVALQTGRAGRRLFVRTPDGTVLEATLAGKEQP